MVFETSLGKIVVELYPDKAPRTVENFLAYVGSGHFEGTIFYRVTDFLIQAGSIEPDLDRRPSREPIPNEAGNGLKNERGTIGMARYEPHSAAAEFYVNLKTNRWLDHTAKTEDGWGYCVFGQVVEGLGTVDRIAGVETASRSGLADVPVLDVLIEKAKIVQKPETATQGDDALGRQDRPGLKKGGSP